MPSLQESLEAARQRQRLLSFSDRVESAREKLAREMTHQPPPATPGEVMHRMFPPQPELDPMLPVPTTLQQFFTPPVMLEDPLTGAPNPAGVQETLSLVAGGGFGGAAADVAIRQGLRNFVDPRVLSGEVRAFPFAPARGVPGEALPPTIGELREGIPAPTIENLRHAPIPTAGAGRSGRLKPREKMLIENSRGSLGIREPERKALENQIRDYRRTHSPRDGWEPFEVTKISRSESGDLKPTYSAASFDFGKGKLTPDARAGVIDTGSQGLIDEVVEVARRARAGDQNARVILNQADWYSGAQKQIHALFETSNVPGKPGLYARLQGAMSPNTRLESQFKNADEFFHRAMRGDFDEQIEAFKAWRAGGGRGIKNLPDHIIPRKLNGKKFGQNGMNALMVMSGEFDKLAPGMGPKMRNFALNLSGESDRPTIDVWAGRSVQRLVGRPRPIPALNAVSGEFHPGFVSPTGELQFGSLGRGAWNQHVMPEVSANYGVALEAFEEAATKLGMDAPDLQALMWFREKEIWEQAGHTAVDEAPDLTRLLRESLQSR